MIQSMTGFGKTHVSLPDVKITIEIKSVNGKFLDCSIRIPPRYKEKELIIRDLIGTRLQRGKIDFLLNEQWVGYNKQLAINTGLVKQYMEDFRKIAPFMSDSELVRIVAHFPDIKMHEDKELDKITWQNTLDKISTALTTLVDFRKTEGSKLQIDLKNQVKKIKTTLEGITPYEQQRIDRLKNKLCSNLKMLDQEFDRNRMEQELIYYIEKLDINEEKVRLDSHCTYFLEELNSNQSNGKKLNFIAQEMGREINTLGAKANNLEIQKLVVQMKDYLERIREQVMNIL